LRSPQAFFFSAWILVLTASRWALLASRTTALMMPHRWLRMVWPTLTIGSRRERDIQSSSFVHQPLIAQPRVEYSQRPRAVSFIAQAFATFRELLRRC
jgi:hypothetical protein